jgi:hypothetical protein
MSGESDGRVTDQVYLSSATNSVAEMTGPPL